MLKCGIIGLPLSGKSTVFNVVTRAGAEVKPYASGKTDPNRAMVNVPDTRFDDLVTIFEPRKETPATVEFVDLAGLSRNASKGEGLGNSFLSFVSESDALVHVIRFFENPDVPHPESSIDPLPGRNSWEMELSSGICSHLKTDSRGFRRKKAYPCRGGGKVLLEKCQACLLEERPLRDLA